MSLRLYTTKVGRLACRPCASRGLFVAIPFDPGLNSRLVGPVSACVGLSSNVQIALKSDCGWLSWLYGGIDAESDTCTADVEGLLGEV